MTMTDIESIMDLDTDAVEAVPCEAASVSYGDLHAQGKETCDNQADVYAMRACCGKIDTLCDDCYDFSKTIHQGPRETIGGFKVQPVCRFCGIILGPYKYSSVLHVRS